MKTQLPIPANWQDFEDLCHKLWRSMWGDCNTQKNGRIGQTQRGVDIFGEPIYKNGFCGVQCKGKTTIYGSKLTEKELVDESKKAETFEPKLKNFTIATTSARDAQIQEKARKMTESNEYSFPINVWSWDEIGDEIQCRPEIYKQFYKIPINLENPTEIHIGCSDTLDKVYMFLSRPQIAEQIPDFIQICLKNLIAELCDNDFRHGEASTVKLSFINNNTFQIIDNGNQFNPSELIYHGNGGHFTLLELKEWFERGLSFKYEYVNDENVVSLILDKDLLRDNSSPLEIEYPFYSDRFCHRDIASQNVKKIINDVKRTQRPIKILIKGNGSLSGGRCYLSELCQHLGKQIISASLPENVSQMYIEILNKYDIKYTLR